MVEIKKLVTNLKMYIDGEWRDSENKETRPVINPANGEKLRAGIIWINSYHPTYNEAPWGGYKQSGIGRSLGTFGLEEFQEIKQININLQVEPIGWFSK